MKKYYIKTFGCQMNESDSERIAGFLENKGYKKAPTIEGANLIVVNTCSVRQTAVDRVWGLFNKIRKIKNQKSKIIITGCVLKSDKKKFEEFLALYHAEGIGSGFDGILTINQFLGKNYLATQPKYLYPQSAFVPIMTGCENFCSYCVVPYTRGREISRSVKEIICEIKNLIKNGCKEITLLGQNVNSYLPAGEASKYSFAKLLKKINNLTGNFQIKFLTSHPKDMSDELINTIAKSKKVFKEIHLPVQSGDDRILRKMNRGYTTKQYLNLIDKIKRKIPDVKITTDVIVGFPSETKKQFENTIKLFKEIRFDKAYVNKYSPRIGTVAYNLKDNVLLKEKKRRWKIINEIANKKLKLIVVLGPTASGKSGLAVKIAKDFNGEIVSGDSRQVYRDINIGTGKITKKEMQGIPHHCLDFASPKKQITVAEYRKKTLQAIDKIYKKGKMPILCGGTGFYIQAVVEGLKIPAVKPDWKLRKELEKKTTKELFKELKKLDPRRAKNIDPNNRRRLIRALEIIKKTGKLIPILERQPQFDILYIGIRKSSQALKKLINKRVDKMIKNGLEKEVKKLVKKYGWTKVLKNTIGYQEWFNAKNKKEAVDRIKSNTFQFVKHQMTWFKKYPGKKINWVKNYQQAKNLFSSFLF